MGRLLGGKTGKIQFADRRSGSMMVIHYTEPTTEQHLAFQNECLLRVGNQVVDRRPEALLKYGKEIFCGFDDGAFLRMHDNGKAVPISCDPKSENYYDDWRGYVEKYAADILQLLAQEVFESSVALRGVPVSEDAEKD